MIIFVVITGLGIFTGNWHNKISNEEYLYHYQNINSMGHPTSTNELRQLNEISESGETNGGK